MSSKTAPAAQAVGEKKRLYIGNLAKTVTQGDLIQLFGLEATTFLRQNCVIELAVDQKSGESKGFAFVTVPEHISGELKNLNNIEFYGRQLVIEESKTPEELKPKQRNNRKGGDNKPRRNNRGNYQYKSNSTIIIEKHDKHDLIDCGVNLTNNKYQGAILEKVIAKAVEAGVTKFIVTGLTLFGSRKAVTMALGRKDVCYAAVSMHPHWLSDTNKGVNKWNDAAEKEIRELAAKPGVVAIGETGIDLNRNFTELDLAMKAFRAQVQIAIDLKKALIVHEREAFDEIMQVLNEKKVDPRVNPVVLHCYTGSVENMEKYIQKGYYIGVTGFFCKEKHGLHLREAVRNGKLPLDRVILQSNAPYMIPNIAANEQLPVDKCLLDCCFPGQNEPHTLSVLVRVIAKDTGKTASEVAHIVNDNARKVFGI